MKKIFSLALVFAIVLSAMVVPTVSADVTQVVNLALGKEAWALSYYNDGTTVLSPDKAVDGAWNKGDYYINGSGAPMYWAVDLGAMCDISSIKFDAVRAWGAGEEFINFSIELSKTRTFTADSTVTVATFGTEGAAEVTSVPVATDENYRYVRFIKTDGTSHLCLVEVEVMGSVVKENVAFGKTAWQNTASLAGNDALYGAANIVDGKWRPYGYGTDILEGTLINCGGVADYYCAIDLRNKYKINEIIMELGRSNGCTQERNMMNIELANKEDFSDAVVVKAYGSDLMSATDAQIIPVTAEGAYRYVRVHKTDGRSCISIAELEVYGELVEENMAYNKEAWASSYVPSGNPAEYAPANAVNGSWDQIPQNTFIACGADTTADAPAFWAVDLGARCDINSIQFAVRYVGCAEEYQNFKIQLSNDRDFASSVDVATFTSAVSPDDKPLVMVDVPGVYRYVRFVKTNTANHLCLAEVEVWGVPVVENLAYNKEVWASSYVPSGNPAEYAPANAVDGSWDKIPQNTFIACGADTAADAPAFWAVDLGARYDIESIQFTGRYVGCDEEYVNFKIQLSNDRDFAAAETVDVATFTTAFSPDARPVVTVDVPRAYRYVRFVKTNTANHLCLAEVEVWGNKTKTSLSFFTDETLTTKMVSIPESNGFAYCLNVVNVDKVNEKTYTVIVASYVGDTLDTVNVYSHSVGAGETDDFVESVAAVKGNEYKVFLWDMSNVSPFIEAIPFR